MRRFRFDRVRSVWREPPSHDSVRITILYLPSILC
jgi:hypothetical protein